MSFNLNPTTLLNLAEAVGGLLQKTAAGANASPLRHDSSLDPTEVLLDLRLPTNVLEMLSPILKLLGFEWDEYTLEDTLGLGDQRKVHRCRLNGALELFLVHIPKWILERNGSNDRAAVDYLRHSFSEGARVYLISEEVDVLKLAFKGNLRAWREQGKINVLLIPWGLLQELQKETLPAQVLTPAKRQGFLKLVFELDDVIEAGSPTITIDLHTAERQRLIDILVARAKNSSPYRKYFEALIKNSNLPAEWETDLISGLEENPTNSARAIIDWAVNAGRNTKRPSYAVLAELIEVVIKTVGAEDKKFLKGLVIDKPLLYDEQAKNEFLQSISNEDK